MMDAAIPAAKRRNAKGALARGLLRTTPFGNAEKVEIARRAGCADVIDCGTRDFVGATLDLTSGKGVEVVYDSVGRATIDGSFACLANRGRRVNFGQASGPVLPIEVTRLFAKSPRIGRPSVFYYIDTPDTLTSPPGWRSPKSPRRASTSR